VIRRGAGRGEVRRRRPDHVVITRRRRRGRVRRRFARWLAANVGDVEVVAPPRGRCFIVARARGAGPRRRWGEAAGYSAPLR
jgi:hypothetical protein